MLVPWAINLANASDDVRGPARTLPRAFALAVGFVIALYFAIAFVVVGSLSPSEIAAASDFALAEAASASLPVESISALVVAALAVEHLVLKHRRPRRAIRA